MFICQSNKSKQQYTHNTHKCFDHTNSESNGETQKGQQIITYIQYGISQFKIYLLRYHCRQRASVGIVLSSSGTSQFGMFDIQATTKCKYYDQIVLLYLESRRCRYRSIIFACFYLYVFVVNLIDYSDIDKMMDINNEKC